MLLKTNISSTVLVQQTCTHAAVICRVPAVIAGAAVAPNVAAVAVVAAYTTAADLAPSHTDPAPDRTTLQHLVPI
jgi:hypothetical protein